MSLQSRLERLARAVPCPACAGEPAETIIQWIEDDEPWPTPEADGDEIRCTVCGGRRQRNIMHIGWQR